MQESHREVHSMQWENQIQSYNQTISHTFDQMSITDIPTASGVIRTTIRRFGAK